MEVLAPPAQQKERELTADEKNFRWALNKFYYTQRKHSLPTAYNLMLQHKYTDAAGQLLPGYPPFHRFKYFYQRHRKEQTALISREGKTNYQRNSRPLLGTIQDFAPSIGTAMLDSTICDVYLVNESNQLVGRPVLTLAVDAYSSLICGYHLSWEGGVYSLQQLMHNVVSDKVAWCQRFGISIAPEEWPVNSLPGVLVTDKGKEFIGNTFTQVTELGVRMINLPPYRPELKGIVEHAFSLIQGYYKPHLKGKGVIEEDFQERGSPDYRKTGCLTINDFEKVLLRCIAFYNSSRVIGSPAYTQEMLDAGVEPTAAAVWRWAYTQAGANLIPVDAVHLKRTLLPRTEGKFTRRGLIVHKQRYRHCDGNFTEHYLTGGSVTVAYNPDDISEVFVLMDGLYTRFELILKVYDSLSLEEVQAMQSQEQAVKKAAQAKKDQAMVDLVSSIETIANGCVRQSDVGLKNIRQTRKTEKQRRKLGGDT
jgi:transposase InsO family protein